MLLCSTDTCQCRAHVGGGGFQEATKLFGSGEKHVNLNQSASSSSYLGLASMSRWNQMTRAKKEREERREENTFERLAKVLQKQKNKKEKSTTFASAWSAAGVDPNLSN